MWAIDQLCFDQDIAYTPDVFFYHLLIKQGTAWLLEAENNTAGFVLTDLQDDTGLIVTIDILPPYRRMGGGTLLLQTAEKALAEKGAGRITLQTEVDNLRAIAFYEKQGYERTGRLRGYYGGKRDAYGYLKVIS